jgi:two-component system sensor histidine kinase KdpD
MMGAALVVVACAALVPVRDDVTRASPALVLVLPVVAAGLGGGRRAALATAAAAAAAFNLAFIPPFWTLKVAVLDDAVAIAVFVVVALAVGTLVAVEQERRRAAEQRAAELEALHRRYQGVVAETERLAEEADRIEVLERVDDQRAALLRSVSHDLRTPLATIRAVATDLRDGTDYDAGTRRELLETVCDEAERLDRLVANLLDLSRIEAGALQPERQAVDVDELVSERVRRLARLFRQVRLQVEVPPGLPFVDGDYTQLDQVLTNLLENAARYAPPASTVRIVARPLAGAGAGAVELRVADEGMGVPDYLRARIFEPFRQGEGSGWSGIGLAICKGVVEAHGGTIAVERTPGGGATFVVTLPARPPVAEPLAGSGSPGPKAGAGG